MRWPKLTIIVGLFSIALAGSSIAADLSRPADFSACIISPDSRIMSLSDADFRAKLEEYYQLSKMEVANTSTIGSTSPRFTWALAAKLQCSVALGYLSTGAVDAQSAQKCDCFTRHMTSFR